jgi:type I restriction enzyme R subunit
MLEKIFGLIPKFKNRDELLEEEFDKFVTDRQPSDADNLIALKYFFKAYIASNQVREIIDNKRFSELNNNAWLPMTAYKAVPPKWRAEIPEYIKDYVSLNKFLD